MDKLGGALGLDTKKTSAAFDVASASILGGIMKKAISGSEGSKAILDMAKNTDVSMLDKLGDMLGGSGSASEGFQKAGGGILDSIVGSGKSGMISAIAKALGLDISSVGKLLAMVAPIVMGMLSKQVKSKGLDVGGLTNLLKSQQGSLSNFLPASLSSDLGLQNLVADASRSVSGAAKKAAGASRAAANDATQASGGLLKTLLPVLLIAALAFGAWKMFFSKAGDINDAAQKAAQSASNAVKDTADELKDEITDLSSNLPSLDSLDFSAIGEAGSTLKSGFSEISKGLTGLAAPNANQASAQSLMDKIGDFSGKIDGLGLDSLEGAAKTALPTIIGTFLQSIQGLIDKIPEPLKTIVQPAVNSLVEKLSAFS